MIPSALHWTSAATDELKAALGAPRVVVPVEKFKPAYSFHVNPHPLRRALANDHPISERLCLPDNLQAGRDRPQWCHDTIAPFAGATVISRRWS